MTYRETLKAIENSINAREAREICKQCRLQLVLIGRRGGGGIYSAAAWSNAAELAEVKAEKIEADFWRDRTDDYYQNEALGK